MNIESTGLIFFSPTNTTKKIVEGIAQGLQSTTKQNYDLTPPNAINQTCHEFTHDLAIIGAPVYSGRLPSIMLSRFKQIKGNGRPAVLVVVYGNRAYEDALIELRNVAIENGFKPIAAGAFIGEHSYSTTDKPLAISRPDAEDMVMAHAFGQAVLNKLHVATNIPNELFQVPGNFPYKDVQLLADMSPSVNEALCSRCGECVRVCPTAAINEDNPISTSKELCIRCCACVKACPSNARIFDNPRIKQAIEWLYATCMDRKEPEIYGLK